MVTFWEEYTLRVNNRNTENDAAGMPGHESGLLVVFVMKAHKYLKGLKNK